MGAKFTMPGRPVHYISLRDLREVFAGVVDSTVPCAPTKHAERPGTGGPITAGYAEW